MRLLFTISLALTMLLGSTMVNAADCKYEKNGVDSFTKQEVILTKWKSFRSFGNQAGHHGWMAGRFENDTHFLGLKLVVRHHSANRLNRNDLHENRLLIPKDAQLLILMADDTIMTLTSSAESAGKSDVYVPGQNGGDANNYLAKTTAIVWYELTPELMTGLRAQGATDIRVSASIGDHDWTFGKKPTDRIQYVLGCVQ